MSSITTNGTSQTRTQDAANETLSASGWDTPAYDRVGNMTTTPAPVTGNLTRSLGCRYDAWNHLTQATDGATVYTYKYDGQGRRIEKVTPGETRHFYLSSQNQVLEERVGTDNFANVQNVWGLRYVDDLTFRDRDTATPRDGTLDQRLYALQDANWNVVAIVGIGGAVVERYTYTAYGKCEIRMPDFSLDGDQASNYAWTALYTAREYDAETGLYYYRARYYSADMAAFIGRDPIGYLGGERNLYRYCGSGPMNGTDPSGLTDVISTEPFPGATKTSDGKYGANIDDGQSGTVELKRITWADVEAEEKSLQERLNGFEKSDGGKSRKYEGGFDSKYFAGENQQHQYYLVGDQSRIYADNEINYIGIGLYEAWLDDSLFKAKLIVWAWKVGRWHDVPTDGTMYWLEEGHNKYTPTTTSGGGGGGCARGRR